MHELLVISKLTSSVHKIKGAPTNVWNIVVNAISYSYFWSSSGYTESEDIMMLSRFLAFLYLCQMSLLKLLYNHVLVPEHGLVVDEDQLQCRREHLLAIQLTFTNLREGAC